MQNFHKKTLLAAATALILLPSLASAERPSREERQAERESFFLAADEDASGGLSVDELVVFVSLAAASHAERKFARADADQSGELSLEEVYKMHRKKHRGKGPR